MPHSRPQSPKLKEITSPSQKTAVTSTQKTKMKPATKITNGFPDPFKKKLKIGVLQSSYANSESEFKDFDNYDCSPAEFLSDHQVDLINLDKAKSYSQIMKAMSAGYDVFINLCDGAFEEDRAGAEVIQTLEIAKVPYTGASLNYYSMDKEQMKLMMQMANVPTPAFIFCKEMTAVKEAADTLTFPLIIKHFNTGGSLGLLKENRVENRNDLLHRAGNMLKKYGGCLIEEFIEGTEYTVLVGENPNDKANPIAFIPVRCNFPPNETFKHFDLKFVNYEGVEWEPTKDEKLAEQLKKISIKTFQACEANSYGRCDMRVKPNGEIYVLEINANCGLFYPRKYYGSADYILSYDSFGAAGFCNLILEAAFKSFSEKQHLKKSSPRFSKATGRVGMYANQAIKTGDVVFSNQGNKFLMHEQDFALKNYSIEKLENLIKFGMPVNDKIIMSSIGKDPYDWQCFYESSYPLDTCVAADVLSGKIAYPEHALTASKNHILNKNISTPVTSKKSTKVKEHNMPILSDTRFGTAHHNEKTDSHDLPPNAAMRGLDIIALTDIKLNEEIVLPAGSHQQFHPHSEDIFKQHPKHHHRKFKHHKHKKSHENHLAIMGAIGFATAAIAVAVFSVIHKK